MKLSRFAAAAALAVCLVAGASAFVPVAYGCSGGLPGSCRDDAHATVNTDGNGSEDGVLSRFVGWLESFV